MSSRNSILNRLKASQRDVAAQPVWSSQRNYADLTAQFTQALTAAGGEVYQAADAAAALAQLGHLFEALQPERVVMNREQPLLDADLPQRWPGIAWHLVGDDDAALRSACVSADIGLSLCDAALAETGTVAVSSGPGKSRLVTLLPPVHVAFVPASRLTADLFTWTSSRHGRLPANTSLVSGPSKSADIGLTLAVGVHGPKRFISIVVASL
jgi:L-lactate dehydrogenase complex protein LldG